MWTIISYSDIERIKTALRAELPDMKSSHRVEALARGLCWNTYAAMLAALRGGPANRGVNQTAFDEYLMEAGYRSIPTDTLWRVIPELAEIDAIAQREMRSDMPDKIEGMCWKLSNMAMTPRS